MRNVNDMTSMNQVNCKSLMSLTLAALGSLNIESGIRVSLGDSRHLSLLKFQLQEFDITMHKNVEVDLVILALSSLILFCRFYLDKWRTMSNENVPKIPNPLLIPEANSEPPAPSTLCSDVLVSLYWHFFRWYLPVIYNYYYICFAPKSSATQFRINATPVKTQRTRAITFIIAACWQWRLSNTFMTTFIPLIYLLKNRVSSMMLIKMTKDYLLSMS